MGYEKPNVPEWLVSELMGRGLTKAQARSKTTEVLIEMLNSEDNKELIKVTREKCEEMLRDTKNQLAEMKETHSKLSEEVKGISDAILAIKAANEEWGGISDQKAKDAISLYSALLEVGKKHGATDITGTGYIVYAFLGGQAARNIYPSSENEHVVIREDQRRPIARRRPASSGYSDDGFEF